MERAGDTAGWATWKEDKSEYCSTCEIFQQGNKATGKRFGLLIKIDEPSKPWDIINSNWLNSLSPGGSCSYDACLVIVYRFSKTPLFIPCFQEDSAMDTAILSRLRVISRKGIPRFIISVRDPKFTSDFGLACTRCLAQSFLFFPAYHPQTYGLAERVIQTLEDIFSLYATNLDLTGFCYEC